MAWQQPDKKYRYIYIQLVISRDEDKKEEEFSTKAQAPAKGVEGEEGGRSWREHGCWGKFKFCSTCFFFFILATIHLSPKFMIVCDQLHYIRMWWKKEKSLLMIAVCSTSGGNVTFELNWSHSSTLQKRVKSHINLVLMWFACLFTGPCMYVDEVCFYRNEEVGKISCWDQEWKETHVVKLRWLKLWMSSLIMNFFACPILVMNLVFRHDEQEEEVMSWAEEVEEMQPSKSFASLFNSSFNSSPTLPRTPPTPWNPAD